MPRHTHPRPSTGHTRGHIREQRIRWIARYRMRTLALWGSDLPYGHRTPVRNPLTLCSCDLCTQRSCRRAERRGERQAARAHIAAAIREHLHADSYR